MLGRRAGRNDGWWDSEDIPVFSRQFNPAADTKARMSISRWAPIAMNYPGASPKVK